MSDYTIIPNQIADTMKKAGCELSDDQLMVFMGCMAVWQDKHNNEIESLKAQLGQYKEALLWSRDSNTGYEPSLSVMQRYYSELLDNVNPELLESEK
jgi:hypothetical protein